MRLGIVLDEADPWGFFNELYAHLRDRYRTIIFKRRVFRLPVFQARINRKLYHRDLRTFLRVNDIVFFEWAGESLMTASRLPKTCGIVTRLHRYEMYKWADRINWETVDKIILVSKAKQKEFADRFPEHAAKTVVTNVSISLEKFTPKPRTFSGDIGILCHLTPRKRVYDLILTFYELLQEKNDLHLHIAGGPRPAHLDYYEALHYIVKELDLQNRVTFYGNVTDTRSWYRNVDIVISNSYSEGLQVTPMEAMASGCYCLSHRWHGAEELLPEEHLFYTNRQLKEKILNYCELPEADRQKIKSNMRTMACEKFDIKKTTERITQYIEEVGAGLNRLSQADE